MPVEIQCVVERAGGPALFLFFDVDLFGLDAELDGIVVDAFLDFVGAFLLVPVDHVGSQVVLFGGFGLDGEDAFGKGYNGLA